MDLNLNSNMIILKGKKLYRCWPSNNYLNSNMIILKVGVVAVIVAIGAIFKFQYDNT